MKILEVKNLKKYFPIYSGVFRRKVGDVKAVDGVSFSVEEGEVVGVVGESGSGKSTAARAAIRLIEPTSGDVSLLGEDFLAYNKKSLRESRLKVQMVFQDPLSSLNPRKTILETIGESLLYHGLVKSKEDQIEAVLGILKKIGIPERALYQYPHQFSGGQQQRISIGRAIATSPKLIVCDEATSALDLSIQAQIVNLLYELKTSLKLSYLFISHDLSVVRNLCDKVIVMYRGKVVESGPVEALFEDPKHPYTQMLLSSIPITHPAQRRKKSPFRHLTEVVYPGCPYFGRCPVSKPSCQNAIPPLKSANKEHAYSCIH